MKDQEIHDYFIRYAQSFAQSAGALADCYATPSVFARSGELWLNPSAMDNMAALGALISQGCTQAALLSLHSASLGEKSVVATVEWDYQDSAGRSLWQSTCSYNILTELRDAASTIFKKFKHVRLNRSRCSTCTQ